jgi:hypothetical protein
LVFKDLNNFLPIHLSMCCIAVISSLIISILYLTDLDDKCHVYSSSSNLNEEKSLLAVGESTVVQ